MSYKSLDIIHDEHRALAAMLSGLRALASGIEAGRLTPDFDLMASMIDYIENVPEKVHHPKENAYLFAKLRQRCDEVLPVIEQLEQEHTQGDARIAELRAALEAYRGAGVSAFAAYQAALKAYIANDNPWQGAAGEYAALFTRIVNMAPAPVGLGG